MNANRRLNSYCVELAAELAAAKKQLAASWEVCSSEWTKHVIKTMIGLTDPDQAGLAVEAYKSYTAHHARTRVLADSVKAKAAKLRSAAERFHSLTGKHIESLPREVWHGVDAGHPGSAVAAQKCSLCQFFGQVKGPPTASSVSVALTASPTRPLP